MTELKPCPFCGSEDAQVKLYSEKGVRFWYVSCENCEISLDPMFWNDNQTKEEAIAKWNRRVNE